MADAPPNNLAAFRVTGKDPAKFAAWFPALMRKLQAVLDRVLDADARLEPENPTMLRDEVKALLSAGIECLKEKAARPGLENAKLEAEIAGLYADAERKVAETRSVKADAKRKEFDQMVRELRLYVGIGRAMIVGEKSKKSVLFAQRLELISQTLAALAQTDGAGH